MATYQNPDLHMHSVFSDGSDSPAELIANVKKAGIDIFALTDHDTYGGCAEVQSLLKPGDPFFVGGVELSCEDEDGKYHILGYCYNVNKPSIVEAVHITHSARRAKVSGRVEYLRSLGFDITEEEVNALMRLENPGKPHLVNLLLSKGYIDDKIKGFEILSAYHSNERVLSPQEAVSAILEADGIPVLAHGILGEGSKKLTEEEITHRVMKLKEYGLMGLECYYSGYTDEQREIMLKLAERFNLLITAGSDYHGKNKPVRLGQTGNPDPEALERFYKTVHLLLG